MSNQMLHVAAANGDLERLRKMQADGKLADGKIDEPINTCMQTTPLMIACSNGHSATAKFLIEAGADVHRPNVRGETALHMAAVEGRLECVKLLVSKGADVNHIDSDKASALHRATQVGALKVVQYLCSAGADKDAVFFSNAPLQWAALCYKEDVENYLQRVGAKPHGVVNKFTGEIEYGILTQREMEKNRHVD